MKMILLYISFIFVLFYSCGSRQINYKFIGIVGTGENSIKVSQGNLFQNGMTTILTTDCSLFIFPAALDFVCSGDSIYYAKTSNVLCIKFIKVNGIAREYRRPRPLSY